MKLKLAGETADLVLSILIEYSPWYAKEGLKTLRTAATPLGISIEVKHNKPKHTTEQQGYYHLCVDLLAKHLGMTHDELHEQVLIEWSGSREVKIGKRTVLVPFKRSAKLSVSEYGELIETLMRMGAFCGYTLPEPEQVSA